MNSVAVIAVDGPGGAGKGTLCRGLARSLGWHYLDSGALYRLLALHMQQKRVSEKHAADLVEDMQIRFSLDDNQVWLNDQPVAEKIRNEEIGALASTIAVRPEVRAALLQKQRAFARSPGLVADGRDMGTVVFPDAPLKIFLDASAEVRARRREKELRDAGKPAIFEKIFHDISERDRRDRQRSNAPLKPAEDARLLDSSGMNAEQVLSAAMDWAVQTGLVTAR